MASSTSDSRKTRVTVTRRVVTTTTRTTITTCGHTTTHHNSKSDGSPDSPLPIEVLRIFLLDIPLMVLFALLVCLTVLQHIHNTYLYPLSRTMVSNSELTEHELTYYDFVCDESDITAFGPEPLILGQSNVTADQAIDKVLHHGMGIFPNLIDARDASSLRGYVLRRNSKLSNDEKIAVLSWPHRYSFGIGANEHPSIPPVLESISRNPLLQSTLEGLLGPNPAVVELSTITSEIGADAQGLHSDTNVETSALKFGRSYVNIYTVLIPLQDTRPESGATMVCPGSHRCSYSPPCFEHAFQVATDKHGIWRAGDGLLYSSDALHQGSAHVDGPDRVALIVSFASRPDHPHWPSKFSRKLPFGAKYAIRWDMTGHTLHDLQNPQQHMTHPWAALRSLGIYKPPRADWGWDGVTMKLAHMVNDRPGFRKEWLQTILQYRVGYLGKIPRFLRGPIENDPDMPAYQGFIMGSVRWTCWFFLFVNVMAVGIYLHLMQRISAKDLNQRPLYAALLRLAICYLPVMVVATWVAAFVACTPWGADIRSEKIARSPFSNVTYRSIDFSEDYVQSLASPSGQDILISDRLQVPQVAAFAAILDYHPGNVRWRKHVADMADVYFAYSRLSSSFPQGIVDAALDGATLSGQHQFLTQNYLGDWVAMSRSAARQITENSIVSERYTFMRPPHFVQTGPCSMFSDSAICRVQLRLLDMLFRTISLQSPAVALNRTNKYRRSLIRARSFLPALLKRRKLVLEGTIAGGTKTVSEFLVGETVEARLRCESNKWLRAMITNVTTNGFTVEYELKPGMVDEDIQRDCIRKLRLAEKDESRIASIARTMR